jgi:hypothetical protein
MAVQPTDERAVALIFAHRTILAYLVKAIAQAMPDEGTAAIRDATTTMLRNSLPQMVASLPDRALAERIIALAEAEIDQIFTAPLKPAPPGGGA